MLRIALVIALVLGVLAGSMPVSAQSTPSANPKLGEPAKVYSNNGEPIGEVTVTDIADPFTDYDVSYSPPARGYRWVKAAVTFTGGTTTLPINTSGFQVVDSDGYIAYQTYIYRTEESTTAEPDLTATEVAAGATVSGVVFFQVFGGSKVELINYNPSYEQSLVAVDLRDAPAVAGDKFEWTTTDGTVVGEVSVAGVVDPLTDFDPSYAPQRGFRYIGIVFVFTNTGDRPVSIDASRFSIIDHEGFVTTYASVYRTTEGTASLPDFPYTEVAPGGQSAGVVTYQLINGATIKDVLFNPTGDRQIRIAEFAKDATFTPPALTPVATVAVDPACDGVLAWGQAVTAALEPATPSFDIIEKINGKEAVTSAEATAAAATLSSVADAMAALDTPDVAQATSDQFVAAIRGMADQMTAIATAIDAQDDAAKTAAATQFYTLAFSLTGGAYSELVTRCPAIADM